jgi:hypothetical protein
VVAFTPNNGGGHCSYPTFQKLNEVVMYRVIPLEFLSVDRVCKEESCGIAVRFSDGTEAFYPPEELAFMRPHREKWADNPSPIHNRIGDR